MRLSLDDFVRLYEGKQVDFDKAFGSQCVDLFREYSKQVLGIPEHTGAVEGAKDLYLNFNSMPKMDKYFQKVFTPRKGDIVIFNASDSNKYGHVAIVLFATNKSLVVFEQDGFNQKKGSYINIWNYDRVLGFIRRK
jgi:hypothetical protein